MKRCLMFLLLFSLSLSAFAFDVKCYSSGQLFYHHKIKNLYMGEGFIINKDKAIREVIMADCIVRYSFISKKKAQV